MEMEIHPCGGKRMTAPLAELLISDELTRRSYTMLRVDQNNPVYDFICVSPNKEWFYIDVKSLHSVSPWMLGREKDELASLFYIFVYHPCLNSTRVFLMSQAEVKEAVAMTWRNKPDRKKCSANNDLKFSDVFPHEDRWDVLPK